MARIRTIKPEFFTSEDIVALSPLARLLYQATWCEADKEGRLQWKPGTFKLRYFPADNCDIYALANELVQRGLVVLYGDGLAYIPQFSRHQHINPRESDSQLPDPNAKPQKATRQQRVTTRHDASARDDDAQVGREGKGKEGSNTNPPPPSAEGGAFARFWESWPANARKVARQQCAEKWAKRGCDAIAEQVLASVAAHKGSPEWQKDDGAYIPAPLVWLNQARWEAPIDTAANDPGAAAAEKTRREQAEFAARPVSRPPDSLKALAQKLKVSA